MANVDTKQQLLLRLLSVELSDLVLVGWIVVSSIRSGIAPDNAGFRRSDNPFGFWLSLVLVVTAGVLLAAVMGYVVLAP
jgi:hypothetical protein